MEQRTKCGEDVHTPTREVKQLGAENTIFITKTIFNILIATILHRLVNSDWKCGQKKMKTHNCNGKKKETWPIVNSAN